MSAPGMTLEEAVEVARRLLAIEKRSHAAWQAKPWKEYEIFVQGMTTFHARNVTALETLIAAVEAGKEKS